MCKYKVLESLLCINATTTERERECGVKDISLFGKVTWENICHIGLSFCLS